MADNDLPQDAVALIGACIASLDALEMLIALARDPARPWTAADLVRARQPTTTTEAATAEQLVLFRVHGLVAETGGKYQYQPSTPELAQAANRLLAAYVEQPVTLFRMVYAIAEKQRIQTFAEAFRIRKELK